MFFFRKVTTLLKRDLKAKIDTLIPPMGITRERIPSHDSTALRLCLVKIAVG
jgi:hypothetical protein